MESTLTGFEQLRIAGIAGPGDVVIIEISDMINESQLSDLLDTLKTAKKDLDIKFLVISNTHSAKIKIARA